MRLFYFLYSFYFFIKFIFIKKHYQIIFYSPQHFNRSFDGENIFLKGLIEICDQEKISYLYLEEPDFYAIKNRSRFSIPFDFIYYLIVLLRKILFRRESLLNRDKKIGRLIKKLFFRKLSFDNYITISQSMLSVFSGISPNSKKFDLQHGTIHANKETYLNAGIVSKNIRDNNVFLLICGEAYKTLLLSHEKANYLISHIRVIGTSIYPKKIISNKTNSNVLVSLQFTHDHSSQENQEIACELENIIRSETSFTFFLRNHPRYNNEICLSRFLKYTNVSLISGDLYSNFSHCSFHITMYSTAAFEAGIHGIPTIFLPTKNLKMNIFSHQYNYPFYNYSLTDVFNNYSECSKSVKKWAHQFYQPLNKIDFLESLSL